MSTFASARRASLKASGSSFPQRPHLIDSGASRASTGRPASHFGHFATIFMRGSQRNGGGQQQVARQHFAHNHGEEIDVEDAGGGLRGLNLRRFPRQIV